MFIYLTYKHLLSTYHVSGFMLSDSYIVYKEEPIVIF